MFKSLYLLTIIIINIKIKIWESNFFVRSININININILISNLEEKKQIYYNWTCF